MLHERPIRQTPADCETVADLFATSHDAFWRPDQTAAAAAAEAKVVLDIVRSRLLITPYELIQLVRSVEALANAALRCWRANGCLQPRDGSFPP